MTDNTAMADQQLITTTTTTGVTTTCFVCNDKFLDPESDKLETSLLSVISQLFHLHLSSYQLGYLAQELICSKCSQILSSILHLYTNLRKIQAEIEQNRCLVKNLIRDSYLQNSTTTTTSASDLEIADKNDEFMKQRLALQDVIIHHQNDGGGTSSTDKSTTDKNPTNTDVEVVQVHEMFGQEAAAAEAHDPMIPTFNLKQIISHQPIVKVGRMPILDQLIRKSKRSAIPYYQSRQQDAKLLARANRNRILHQQQRQRHQIKIEKKPTLVVKKEKAEGYNAVEEVELITADLGDNDDDDEDDELDWGGDNNFDNDEDYDPSSETMFNPSIKKSPPKKKKTGASKHSRAPTDADNDDPYNFFCTICGKPFKTHDYANKHADTHNPVGKTFKCDMEGCESVFFHPRELRKHVRRVHELGNNKHKVRRWPAAGGGGAPTRLHCPQCPRTFSKERQEIFQIHVECHKPPDQRTKNYSCHICGREFFSHSRLRQHLRRVHDPSFKSSARKAQCPICGLQVGKLSAHLRVHSETKPFSCSICGASFRAKNTLNVHMRVHLDLRPYACTSCPANFRTSHGLKRHVFIHSEERSFVCEHCGKDFRLKSSLTEHLHIHLQVKPHRCNVCGKRFKERRELEVHLRDDHTVEKREGRKRPRPVWRDSSTKGSLGGGQGRLSSGHAHQGLRLPPYHDDEDEEGEAVQLVQHVRFTTPPTSLQQTQQQQQYPTSSSLSSSSSLNNNNKFVTYQIQYPHL